MSSHPLTVVKAQSFRGKIRSLIWEKGNMPKDYIIEWWFKRFFGGRNWKIIGKYKFSRSKDGKAYE